MRLRESPVNARTNKVGKNEKSFYLKEGFVFHKIECIEDIEIVLFGKNKGIVDEGVKRSSSGNMVV